MLLGLGCMVRVDEPQALLETWRQLQKRCGDLIDYNSKAEK